MCIDCHQEAVKHLIAMLLAGRAAPVEPPARFAHDAEVLAHHVEQIGIAGGHVARVLALTMVNGTDPKDATPVFNVNDTNRAEIAGWFSMLSADQLQTLRVHLGALNAAAGIAHQVTIDAMGARAEAGDLASAVNLGLVQVHQLAPNITVVNIPPSSGFTMPKSGNPKLN